MSGVNLDWAFFCATRNASEAGAGDGPGRTQFGFTL